MESTPENLRALADYLTHTLSANYEIRKQAEEYLMSVEGTPNYSMLLLQLADSEEVQGPIRLAAAVTFKNFVRRNWHILQDETSKISEADRQLIKKHIVTLMLKTPENVQKQLSDAITFIGRDDFPGKWEGLLPEMIAHFKSSNFNAINGVLRTAHSLTKRYRYEFKSEELWKEILFVLNNFAAALSELLVSTMQLASTHAQNPSILKILFSSLLLITKIFYSLTYQELPDHFADDQLKPWMQHFHTLLTTDNKLLETSDDDEAGLLEMIKSQICTVVAMFAQKYDEDFSDYLSKFVQSVWGLLVSTDVRPKNDVLVSSGIEFLASVIERPVYKDLFADETTLRNICVNVIVPNMQFREADEEQFEDNPEEYIRRDLESSDVGTRRHSATNLVRGLCKHFEEVITSIFSSYIDSLLQQYSQDQEKNWRCKDTALYLIAALASRSKTTKHGITRTSDLVNVLEIFNVQCLPELQAPDVNKQPVLRADAIRYLTTFRSVLPGETLISSLPVLQAQLASSSMVVHTYAAHCVEKLLILRGADGNLVLTSAHIKPYFEQYLVSLFNCLSMPGSEENEYVMKAIMRLLSTIKDEVVPYSDSLLRELAAKLALVYQNPRKPHFNHYLFESISCIIRYTCASKNNAEMAAKFEDALFPLIENILVRDISEFLPYMFQILSLLLEVRPLPIPPTYLTIYPVLLTPVLWEHTGNIPALVRLLQAFIEKASSEVCNGEKLLHLLGVFQKLIASKANDHEGFNLLGSMVEHLNMELLSAHLKSVFVILFHRLQNSKTAKYVKGLLVFLCLFAGTRGGSLLIQTVDSIQPKLFSMLLEKVFITDVQKVSGFPERKICAIGITKILTETPEMMLEPYHSLWTPLLQTLIGLFELPEDGDIPEEDLILEVEDTSGYQTTYSQLVMAGTKNRDPFVTAVPNAKVLLAQSLHRLSSQHPGKLQNMITNGLTSEASTFLHGYLQSANVSALL